MREVYGVDLSEDMLRRAQEKVDRRGFDHVKSLQVMDVTRLGFPDEMFDAVAAQFLITLVPEPGGRLTEFARVLRPGGEIILANHFGQPAGPACQGSRRSRLRLPAAIGWSSRFQGVAGRGLGARDRPDGGGGAEAPSSPRASSS